MEQSGETQIGAKPREVWRALQNPSVLKECVDGCEEMELLEPGKYRALVAAKVGPVRAKFKATIAIENEDPPHSYTLLVEVQGGAAGFGKGAADVTLTPQGDSTRLSYIVKGNVGGRLAQVGSRLIVSASRKMADRFFTNFAKLWVNT